MKFILIDESIVSSGWWAKIQGALLDQFRKNPIMLWMHQRASRYDEKRDILPIGIWKNIQIETINGVLAITAEPEFDTDDEFALKIKAKVEKEHIRMASAGLIPLAWSDKPEDMKSGQTDSTITEWEMIEASIVDIGANRNAFRLYESDGVTLNLSFGQKKSNQINIKMKSIALKLGLPEHATEAEINAAIETLQGNADKAVKLLAERKTKLLAHPAVTDENRQMLSELADVNFGLAEKTIGIIETKTPAAKGQTERLSQIIEQHRPGAATQTAKTWETLSDAEREALHTSDLSSYKTLYEAYYGFKPKK